MVIYFSGNDLLPDDSMPHRLIPGLREMFPQIDFKHHDPNENLPIDYQNDDNRFVIIDTVINTDKVIAIDDINKLAADSIYSPHDWDLALNLKLLSRLGLIKGLLIIGVPPAGDEHSILNDTAVIIRSIL